MDKLHWHGSEISPSRHSSNNKKSAAYCMEGGSNEVVFITLEYAVKPGFQVMIINDHLQYLL